MGSVKGVTVQLLAHTVTQRVVKGVLWSEALAGKVVLRAAEGGSLDRKGLWGDHSGWQAAAA